MSDRRVLDNWKEIASYLGRTGKTCRNWEKEYGLPVHRLDGSPRAHVFAYADELERWKEEMLREEERHKGTAHGLEWEKELRGQNRVGGLVLRLLLRLFRKPLIAIPAVIILVGAIAAAILVVVGLLPGPIRFAKRSPGPQTIRTIAVLPFVDLSPGKDQEHLGDGIADILINALNGVEGLRTAARTSAFHFKGAKATPQEISRKLEVEWILEGSVQIHENKLRVVATLLNAADGYELWSERYDRNPADIFAVEDEIARRVVDNLKVSINGRRGAPLVRPGTQNLEAYSFYLNGWYFLKKGRYSLGKALDFFGKALEKDPNYAEAYAGIALVYACWGQSGSIRPSEAFPKAKAAALKALEIDARNPYALGTLVDIKTVYDWDFVGAEDDIRKAIQADPGNPYLHGYYAKLLTALARYEEALAEVGLAIRRDPVSLHLLGVSAEWVYWLSRKYELALEGYKKRLELDPQNPEILIGLWAVYFSMGRYEEARAANQRRRELLGTSSQQDGIDNYSALIHARTGNQARAREILANKKAYRNDHYQSCHVIAWTHAALGEKDEAFFWLEQAYREHAGQLYLLKVLPTVDPLRSDPRFKDLLRRIGLEK